jgi:glycosyltransferase involved in cell wall biosynthesis
MNQKGVIIPTLSVIIPAYNEEKHILQCVTSLQHQTTDLPYEIIVVDNNSTDKTSQLARSLKTRVVHEKIRGASAARNAGATASQGRFLVFIDADCVAPANHLQTIFKTFRNNKIDVIAGPYIINDAGPGINWLTGTMNYYSWYFRIVHSIFHVQAFAGGNFAVKKSVYKNIGGFDPKIDDVIMAEDLEFAVRLNKSGHHIYFDSNLKIFSSFRRIKRAPLSTSVIRFLYSLKYLTS